MDNRLGRDLLSGLPVDIIECILMFLPIRDAIRTSILSSKWRYRWTSLPQLVFDEDTMGSSTSGGAINQRRLENFVTRTLFRHEGPIPKFKLHISSMFCGPFTYLWLHFLSVRDVKELILECFVDLHQYFPVPPCPYSFQNLTFLMLDGCKFSPPPPTFKGFLCLRTLILQNVEASSGTIESLVANSPLLENLECTYVRHSGDSALKISAPNLKCFCIGNTFTEIYLCAPLFANMTITLDPEDEQLRYWKWQKHSGCNYTKFLGGVTNLESLTGDGIFPVYLSNGIQYCHHPLVFDHLKIITLGQVNFENVNEILVAVRLIMDAVNLCELQFACYSSELDGLKAPDINFWNSECPQKCTFRKLIPMN